MVSAPSRTPLPHRAAGAPRALSGSVFHLLLGLLLPVAPLAAQDTIAVRSANVVYLTGSSIYITAGRADGLVEGQNVSVIRHDSVAATLRVAFLSSHQAACELVRGTADVSVGDLIHYLPSLPATITPTTGVASSRRPTRHRLSGPGIHGRIGARYLVAQESPGSGGFHQPSVDLRFDGLGVAGTPLGLAIDVRTRRTTSSSTNGTSTVDGHTRLYQAALFWNQPGSGFRLAVGRQYLTAVTSVSLFDGGLVEVGGSHLTVGAFGGTEPAPANLGYSREVQDFGGYFQLHSATGSGSPWSITTGGVGSYSSGKANREFAFLQTSFNTRALSVYGLQEMDYYRPWKVQQGEPAISPTSTYLSTSLRPARWLALNVAYDNRRSVRLYRDAVDPATSFDDAYRKGVWSGLSLIGRRVRLSGDVRFSDGGTSGSATAYTGTFGLDRMTPLHLSFTGRATQYRNATLDGRIFTGRIGVDPWQAVHLDLNGGLRNEHSPLADPSHRNITWFGGDLDVSIARAWYLSLSGQRERSPDLTTTQLYSSLSWRF
ncbi:MAG: hypothetical protein ABI587_13090 [Gemmatimonadales bacterium]